MTSAFMACRQGRRQGWDVHYAMLGEVHQGHCHPFRPWTGWKARPLRPSGLGLGQVKGWGGTGCWSRVAWLPKETDRRQEIKLNSGRGPSRRLLHHTLKTHQKVMRQGLLW